MKTFINLVISLIKKFMHKLFAVLTSSIEESNANTTVNNININNTVKGKKKKKKKKKKRKHKKKSKEWIIKKDKIFFITYTT